MSLSYASFTIHLMVEPSIKILILFILIILLFTDSQLDLHFSCQKIVLVALRNLWSWKGLSRVKLL